MDNVKVSSFFEPYMALMIYRNASNLNELEEWYMESHNVVDGSMGAGKPLTEDCLEEEFTEFLMSKKREIKEIKDVLPENLIYYKMRPKAWPEMMWYIKAGKHDLFFNESLGVPNGTAHTPALLFYASSHGFRVYALKNNNRPKFDTVLYYPPFHNCNSDGLVCMGSAKLVKPMNANWLNMMAWHESRFFRSIFSATHSTKVKGNINLIWKDLIQNPEKKFDKSVLVKSKTIRQILK